ncbi:hypothetical protein OJF2_50940 [Aquisphaera giovannonii]|uniref:Phage head-tail joining protein n=1 Tax=Aquisphaera giovannonii TaxID=406548 RepID=A0A5B9W9K5_9BACT|nr:hypothetical protein [Aquisphaera giovannonii]QEH36510.1 hypothetical protein OJF2_50940 [Aquisphaera giovannonii]
MSFLYPRRISISRPTPTAGYGAQPYGGLSPDNETEIASDLAAHIQIDKGSLAPQAKLAADAAYQTFWKIIIKAARGLVQRGDVIADDLGNRYQVISADWGPMVTTLRAQVLET